MKRVATYSFQDAGLLGALVRLCPEPEPPPGSSHGGRCLSDNNHVVLALALNIELSCYSTLLPCSQTDRQTDGRTDGQAQL